MKLETGDDIPLLLSVFSCVQEFVDEEVLEFKRDFKDDDKDDDEQENFLLNGWCDEITTDSDLDDETTDSLCRAGDSDVPSVQATGTNAEQKIPTTVDAVFERRNNQISLKQKSLQSRKAARCGVKRASQRFRYTRGLPGKASKRMEYSLDLFLPPSLSTHGRGKRPIWRVSRRHS